MSHLIELKDVYKIYHMGEETVHALDGINLTVDQGEFGCPREAHDTHAVKAARRALALGLDG